jgi:hypothetical protein
VRELCDLGESTLEGSTLRDSMRALGAVALLGAVVVALARFFGRSRSAPAFSLSD